MKSLSIQLVAKNDIDISILFRPEPLLFSNKQQTNCLEDVLVAIPLFKPDWSSRPPQDPQHDLCLHPWPQRACQQSRRSEH